MAACIDAIGLVGQRAAIQGYGSMCAWISQLLLDYLDSVAPPVRHAAAVGLQYIANVSEVQDQAALLLPKLVAACDDRSVVMDHCARAPATDAVAALVGGGRARSLLKQLVAARYTA